MLCDCNMSKSVRQKWELRSEIRLNKAVASCTAKHRITMFVDHFFAQVRRQMKLRLKNHEERNAARKKTGEEKREKKIAKLGKNPSATWYPSRLKGTLVFAAERHGHFPTA